MIAASLIIALFGTSAVSSYLENAKQNDPREIVIDEFLGMIIALLFVPHSVGAVGGAFVLFRIFDIITPPPISRLESWEGAKGVMADDIAAGLIANVLIQVIV